MKSQHGLTQKDKTLINAKKSCESSVDLRGHYLSCLPGVVSQNPLHFTLQCLELSYNDFIEIPREVCSLTNLRELYIQYNKVKCIPVELSRLTKLRRLGLAHNKLNSIPQVCNKLLELEWLNLSGNEFKEIPLFVLYFPRLVSLWLICNPIRNVPREVYIQGLMAMRDYFNVEIKLVKDSNGDYGNTLNKDVSSTLLENEMQLESHSDDFHKEAANIPDEFLPSKEDFCAAHTKVVSVVQHSQKCELQMIRDLKEKLKINQEIRRMNIDYLKNKRNKRKSFRRTRRTSDLSLDSGITDHHSHCLDTSEYGSLSTVKLSYYDRKDSVEDSNHSIITSSSSSQVSMHCSDYSDNDLSDIELPPSSRRHITCGDICVIIPECNLSGHFQSEFFLEIIHDLSYEPPLKSREVLASEVLMMGPHGARFYKSDPAIISMPYDVKVTSKEQIVCWCSNTGTGEKPRWIPMKNSSYTVYDEHVEIQAKHFSLFAVTAQKLYPSAQKLIKKGIGGFLYVQEVPGVEVNFPETSLLYDIEASIKVLYSDDPYDVEHNDPNSHGLAAPVVELGPHGCQFDESSHDHVTVRLPLPNGKDILELYGDRQLTFWYSSTLQDEELYWQQFCPRTVSIDVDDDSLCSVYFSVEHFTFFRVLWDVLDAVLYEAKLGASHYLPVFQFYVSCQALMSESEDGARFGLCISCSRFGKPLEGIGNFPIPIGNHPPKMIRTGPLSIRVISGLFEADSAAGQESLNHTETFTGRQVVVQFICRFKCERPPAFGSFGRVEIDHLSCNGVPENIFSFNLDKPRDSLPLQSSHAWDVYLSRELAALVTISTERDMGDSVWEDVAHALRYTQAEITKIGSSSDPMTELLANYKGRGGQPHEFISAMYSIGQYKTSPHNKKSAGRTFNVTSGESLSTNSSGQMCPCTNKRKRKLPDISMEERFNEVTGKILGKWKELGRILKVNENKLKEIEQDYKQDGVREQAYQMLLSWRDSYPDHCTLKTLSNALCKMGLGYVARQNCMVEMG